MWLLYWDRISRNPRSQTPWIAKVCLQLRVFLPPNAEIVVCAVMPSSWASSVVSLWWQHSRALILPLCFQIFSPLHPPSHRSFWVTWTWLSGYSPAWSWVQCSACFPSAGFMGVCYCSYNELLIILILIINRHTVAFNFLPQCVTVLWQASLDCWEALCIFADSPGVWG